MPAPRGTEIYKLGAEIGECLRRGIDPAIEIRLSYLTSNYQTLIISDEPTTQLDKQSIGRYLADLD